MVEDEDRADAPDAEVAPEEAAADESADQAAAEEDEDETEAL